MFDFNALLAEVSKGARRASGESQRAAPPGSTKARASAGSRSAARTASPAATGSSWSVLQPALEMLSQAKPDATAEWNALPQRAGRNSDLYPQSLQDPSSGDRRNGRTDDYRPDVEAELAKQDVVKAQQQLDKDRGKRVRALDGGKPDVSLKAKEMTADRYNSLTARQRAGVDFNTVLSDAVAKDLKSQDKYAKLGVRERETYEEASKNMFGDDRGSDIFAPETLAVLRQLKLDDTSADLDDYLGLKAAISENDLNMLVSNKTVAPLPVQKAMNAALGNENSPTPGEPTGRAEFVAGLADKTAALQASLAKGNQMLQDFRSTSVAMRATDTQNLGGAVAGEKPVTGYGSSDADTYFQTAFEALSNKANAKDKEEILTQVRAGMPEGDFDKFFNYAAQRTTTAKNYGMELGATKGATYYTPDEFRDFLGMGE